MTQHKALAREAAPTSTPTPWRSIYPVHPCADVFPMMSDAELEALAADIKAHGLQQHVVLWHDPSVRTKRKTYFVLDGRNRLDALTRLGVVLPTPDDPRELVSLPGGRLDEVFELAEQTDYDPDVYNVDDPAAFVIGANLRRRHLTKEQQAELIVKTIEAGRKENDSAKVARSFSPTSGRKGGSTKDPVLAKAVAEGQKHGISKRTVERASAKAHGKTARLPITKTSAAPGLIPPSNSQVHALRRVSAVLGDGLRILSALLKTPDLAGCVDSRDRVVQQQRDLVLANLQAIRDVVAEIKSRLTLRSDGRNSQGG